MNSVNKKVEQYSDNEILEMIKSDMKFCINLISMHYAFNESEIDKYSKVLDRGDAYYAYFIRDSYDAIIPKWGLCFNENILWTDKLKDKWEVGFWDPYEGANSMGYDEYYLKQMLNECNEEERSDSIEAEVDIDLLFGSNDLPSEPHPFETDEEASNKLYKEPIGFDEYKFVENEMTIEEMLSEKNKYKTEIKFTHNDRCIITYYECGLPRNEMPLSVMTEIDCVNYTVFQYELELLNDGGGSDLNFHTFEIDDFTREYTMLSISEFENLLSKNRSLVLLNKSVWNNTLKPIFTEKVVFEILDKLMLDVVE